MTSSLGWVVFSWTSSNLAESKGKQKQKQKHGLPGAAQFVMLSVLADLPSQGIEKIRA